MLQKKQSMKQKRENKLTPILLFLKIMQSQILVQKTIKARTIKYCDMSEQVPKDLRELIINFVKTYSNVADLELDLHLHPKPSFMPLNSYDTKKEAAHYFLLAAALSDYQLTGNPRSIQLLLSFLSEVFGRKLYTIVDPLVFKSEVEKFEQKIENLDRLGKEKTEIPEVICSVNQFVAQKAQGDLINYTTTISQKGRKPKDFVETLSYSVKRMNKQAMATMTGMQTAASTATMPRGRATGAAQSADSGPSQVRRSWCNVHFGEALGNLKHWSLLEI